jgi:hypothetical protein
VLLRTGVDAKSVEAYVGEIILSKKYRAYDIYDFMLLTKKLCKRITSEPDVYRVAIETAQTLGVGAEDLIYSSYYYSGMLSTLKKTVKDDADSYCQKTLSRTKKRKEDLSAEREQRLKVIAECTKRIAEIDNEIIAGEEQAQDTLQMVKRNKEVADEVLKNKLEELKVESKKIQDNAK